MEDFRSLRRRRVAPDFLMFDRPRSARGIVPLIVAGGLAAAGTIGAAALSANAASSQARAARNADRETREFTQTQYNLGELRQLARVLGGEEALRQLRATTPEAEYARLFGRPATDPTFTRDQQESLREMTQRRGELRDTAQRLLNSQAGVWGNGRLSDLSSADQARYMQMIREASDLDNQIQQLNTAAGGEAGSLGLLREEDLLNIRGIAQDYDAMAQRSRQEGIDNLSRYDNESQALDQQARDMEAQASRFGQGQTERARRDAAESLKGSNQAATAAMAARGLLGSSALTGAIGENYTQNQRALSDTLSGLEDDQIRLRTGLQTGRLGLSANRSQGRTAVQMGGQDVTRGLELGALNLRNQALTGPSSNPWLESGVPAFSAASPSAASGAAWAQGLAGLSSPVLGYSMGGLFDSAGRANTGGGGLTGGGLMPYDSTRLPYAGRAG